MNTDGSTNELSVGGGGPAGGSSRALVGAGGSSPTPARAAEDPQFSHMLEVCFRWIKQTNRAVRGTCLPYGISGYLMRVL